MLSLLFGNPIAFFILFPLLVMTITIHEFAHAYAADKLGDPTPSLQGRVTLNPLKHLDPLGTLLILVTWFGWGRPVQFDPYNLENPRRDAAFIAFAGPLSNIIMAVFGAVLALIFSDGIFFAVLALFVQLNIGLALFNLIPVHPLDGFKIVGGLLSENQAIEWYPLSRYGILFLILLIFPIGPNGRSMIDYILIPVINFTVNLLI